MHQYGDGHKSKPKIGTKCVCTSRDYYLDYVGLDDKKLKQANDVTFLTKYLIKSLTSTTRPTINILQMIYLATIQ